MREGLGARLVYRYDCSELGYSIDVKAVREGLGARLVYRYDCAELGYSIDVMPA